MSGLQPKASHPVRLGDAQLHRVVAGGIELDIILRLGPERLAALLAVVQREGNVRSAAQRIAAFVGGDIRELDQRWYLGRRRALLPVV